MPNVLVDEKRYDDYRRIMHQAAEVADALDHAERIGTETDEPEGTRFIQISDTLARQLAQRLRIQ